MKAKMKMKTGGQKITKNKTLNPAGAGLMKTGGMVNKNAAAVVAPKGPAKVNVAAKAMKAKKKK